MGQSLARVLSEEKDLAKAVKITWYGHSMFLLEDDRDKIVIDPFLPAMVGYSRPEVEADIVLVSHGHRDHNNVEMVGGGPKVLAKAGVHEEDHVKITGIGTYHDQNRGAERGPNIVFRIEMKGMVFEHLGDLGCIPQGGEVAELKGPDILFVPVGGIFTIDADAAAEVVKMLSPRIAIPMHYGTPAAKIPLATEEPFIKHFGNVERTDRGPIYLSREELPEPTLVLVMGYVT
jgi:L-ascorbate metabolism protein UlaG (beta-lactamase superfamily)